LYSCALKPKTVVATVQPSASPSFMPAAPTAPTVPTATQPEPCGMFGLSFFCPRRGHCGFLRRLFNMGGC
jgi:hypothetical protein